VDSFVSVQTKTIQAPDALQSTATYSTTIDSNNNWQITDVGGIGFCDGTEIAQSASRETRPACEDEESAVGHGTRSAWFTLREGSAVANAQRQRVRKMRGRFDAPPLSSAAQ